MKIFPVVHINENNVYNAVRESVQALNTGVDGLYLTDRHNGIKNTKPIYDAFVDLLDEIDDKYIGIHVPIDSPLFAVRSFARLLGKVDNSKSVPSGLWVDNMRGDFLNKSAEIEYRNENPKNKNIRILGGIAFKNTKTFTEDPDMARYETLWLKDSVDVILTSGATIDRQPTYEKLVAMKEVAGDKSIAVLGNIPINSLYKYSGIIDELLVSTSVETSPGSCKIDYDKLHELTDAVHEL